MAQVALRKPLRVIDGRAICGGDCPMFQANGLPLRGYCLESQRACHVGQLCFEPTGLGGSTRPFARFAPDPSHWRARAARSEVLAAKRRVNGTQTAPLLKLLPFPPREPPPAKPARTPKPPKRTVYPPVPIKPAAQPAAWEATTAEMAAGGPASGGRGPRQTEVWKPRKRLHQ